MVLIFISAFAATTMMTLFSYMVSDITSKIYKEPLLLEFLMSKLPVRLNASVKTMLSWTIHYAIGLMFVIVFHWIVVETSPKKLWIFGIIYGSIIGTLGIIGWHSIFSFTGKHPGTDLPGYYSQLFVAHLLFAMTVVALYD